MNIIIVLKKYNRKYLFFLIYFQIDFNRHLEVLAQNIQLFSEEFLQEIFKSEPGSSKIIDVLISWHMFVKLSTTKLGK